MTAYIQTRKCHGGSELIDEPTGELIIRHRRNSIHTHGRSGNTTLDAACLSGLKRKSLMQTTPRDTRDAIETRRSRHQRTQLTPSNIPDTNEHSRHQGDNCLVFSQRGGCGGEVNIMQPVISQRIPRVRLSWGSCALTSTLAGSLACLVTPSKEIGYIEGLERVTGGGVFGAHLQA